MHILFLTDNFPPEVNAPATRTFEHAIEWVRRGAKVTVITGAPNFPTGKVFDGHRNRPYQVEQMACGITVVRVWTYIAANRGFGRRIADYVSFAVTSAIGGVFVRDVDLIVATSPQFFTTCSGLLLSWMKRRPWVFELRDLWPESIRTVGAMQSNVTLRALEKLELFLYRQSDLVISVTNSFVDNLESRGISREKMRVVRNGVNLDAYSVRAKDHELIKQLGLEKTFVVGYLGTIGMAHGLHELLPYLPKECAGKPVSLLVVGEGAERERAEEAAVSAGIKNVRFVGMVNKSEVPRYLSIFDCGLVPLREDPNFERVIPSKIFELCAMGKPILLGVRGEAQDLVMQYGAGTCFRPGNGEDFARALRDIATNDVRTEAMSAGARKLAEDFDRRKLATRMLGYLEELTAGR
jgi:glycosyltransferase involved in cell wall biosynthesis